MIEESIKKKVGMGRSRFKTCERCGRRDGVEFYQHIYKGISLCEECADCPCVEIEKMIQEIEDGQGQDKGPAAVIG